MTIEDQFIGDWLFHFLFSVCFQFSWEKKIPFVCDGLERTWLFHEIGWCYLELDRHKEARDYGVRSVAAADEIADEKWQINANVLVAQSECNIFIVFTKSVTVTCHLICLIVNFSN